MTRLTAHRFLNKGAKSERSERKGNATQSPLPCGGGWGWVVKGSEQKANQSRAKSEKARNKKRAERAKKATPLLSQKPPKKQGTP